MSVFVSAGIRLTLIWLRFNYHRSKLTQILSPSPAHGPAPGLSLGQSLTTRPAPTRPPRPRPCSRSQEQPPTSSRTSACQRTMQNTGRRHPWPAMISRRATAFIYTITFLLILLAIIIIIITSSSHSSSSSARRRSCRLSNRCLLLVLHRRGRAARPAVTPGATCRTPTWSPRRSRAHRRRGWRSRRSTTGWSRACRTSRTKETATVPLAGRLVTACVWGRVGAYAHERPVSILSFLHGPQMLRWRLGTAVVQRLCQCPVESQFCSRTHCHAFFNLKTLVVSGGRLRNSQYHFFILIKSHKGMLQKTFNYVFPNMGKILSTFSTKHLSHGLCGMVTQIMGQWNLNVFQPPG